MQESTRGRRARFGPFEVDLRNREIRRQGLRLRVQRQPFAVLETLLETPGDLVSRETLREKLWPDGTFVEFDKGLNTAVMKLREVLGEDSQAPHFIETVAGEGYRFVATVQFADLEPLRGGVDSDAPLAISNGSDSSSPPATASAEPTGGSRRWISAALLVAAIVLGAGAVVALLLRPDAGGPPPTMLRFTLRAPPGATFSTQGSFMALSPDGSKIAFVASSRDGFDRLFLQSLDSLTAQAIEDTEDAEPPFWSPDGSALAFFARGRLKRLDLASGSLRTLDAVSPMGVTGTWGDRGDLLYSLKRGGSTEDHHGLQRAPAEGGPATALALPDGVDPAAYLWWPRLLPGGRSYLFLAVGGAESSGIHVASLDGGSAERISPVISSPEYADGHLFYVDRGVLLAHPFDPIRKQITGAPVPLADGVMVNATTGRAVFSVTGGNGGIVAYRQPALSRLEWFDRAGSSLGVAGPPGVYQDFSIARDGERVAAAMLDPGTATHDIWILDAGGSKRRLTVGPASEISPVWSEDGSRIAYASNANGRWQILVQSVRKGSDPELVAESAGSIIPTSWRGPVLQIGRFSAGIQVKVRSSGSVRVAAESAMGLFDSASPDGQWLAKLRSEGTSRTVTKTLYVDAIAPRRDSRHVATLASEPRWRDDGGELYYMGDDRTLTAVDVERGDSLELGPPVPLFATAAVEASGMTGSTYDAAPDGQRFLVKVAVEPASIVVLANWKSALD